MGGSLKTKRGIRHWGRRWRACCGGILEEPVGNAETFLLPFLFVLHIWHWSPKIGGNGSLKSGRVISS
jgi:hypothetical protein